jgi:hypothetical protein
MEVSVMCTICGKMTKIPAELTFDNSLVNKYGIELILNMFKYNNMKYGFSIEIEKFKWFSVDSKHVNLFYKKREKYKNIDIFDRSFWEDNETLWCDYCIIS